MLNGVNLQRFGIRALFVLGLGLFFWIGVWMHRYAEVERQDSFYDIARAQAEFINRAIGQRQVSRDDLLIFKALRADPSDTEIMDQFTADLRQKHPHTKLTALLQFCGIDPCEGDQRGGIEPVMVDVARVLLGDGWRVLSGSLSGADAFEHYTLGPLGSAGGVSDRFVSGGLGLGENIWSFYPHAPGEPATFQNSDMFLMSRLSGLNGDFYLVVQAVDANAFLQTALMDPGQLFGGLITFPTTLGTAGTGLGAGELAQRITRLPDGTLATHFPGPRNYPNWYYRIQSVPGFFEARWALPVFVTLLGSTLILCLYFVFRLYATNEARISQKVDEQTQELRDIQTDLQKRNRLLRRMNEELVHTRELAESSNRAKTDFLANMSHELRTPLNAILGFAQLLKTEILGKLGHDRYREYVDDIHKSGQHLLSLIDDVLDLAKLESGRLSIRVEAMSPTLELQRVLKMVRPHIERKGLRLSWAISDTLPGHLSGDPTRVRQILLNLVSNAYKFTDSGFVKVYLGTESLDDGSPGWLIRVEDSGRGIPEKQVSLVFERFVRTGDVATRHEDGSGLGLAICSELVACMGGEISVKSELGKGSAFSVVLPLVEIDQGQTEGVVEAAALKSVAG